MKNSKTRSCVALVAALAMSSCSYIALKAPADTSGSTPPSCSQESDSPWLDAVSAGSFVIPGVIAGSMVANCQSDNLDDELCDGATIGAISSGVMALVLTASAISGHRKLKKCKTAHANWEAQIAQPTLDVPPSVLPPGMQSPGANHALPTPQPKSP